MPIWIGGGNPHGMVDSSFGYDKETWFKMGGTSIEFGNIKKEKRLSWN